MRPRLLSLLATLILTATAVGTVSAHRPLWAEDQGLTELPDIRTSFAVYRDLRQPGEVHLYTFQAQAGDRLHAGINVPAVAGLEAYGVSVALLGPGLPEVPHDALPPQHPEDLGGLLFTSARSEDFFEGFTQTRYWGRQRLDTRLPETGTYYLAVWQPEGVPGKYVMDTGTAEVFGPGDLFLFPIWWLQVHLFFGHGPYLAAGGVLVALLAAAAGWRRWRPAPRPVEVLA